MIILMATFGINFLIICSNTTQFDLQQKNINRTIFRIFRKRGGAVEIWYASLLYVEFSVEFSAKTFWHRQLITAPPSRIGLSGSINYVASGQKFSWNYWCTAVGLRKTLLLHKQIKNHATLVYENSARKCYQDVFFITNMQFNNPTSMPQT